jgi:hypothetical protein
MSPRSLTNKSTHLSPPLWTFLGGLIAAAIGLILFLIGINETVNRIDPKSGKPIENPINALEIIGMVLMYTGGTVSSVGFIWLIIDLIANLIKKLRQPTKQKRSIAIN